MLNSRSAVSVNGACLGQTGALIPPLRSDFQLLTVNFQHPLGLRRRVRGRLSRTLGLGDRGERLNVEFLVVPIPRHDAGLDPFHQQKAHANVRFHIGRQPHLVVHKCLLVNEAGSLLQVRQQAAGKFHVAGEIRLQPRHVVRFFVDPNDTGEFLSKSFHQLVRLEFGIRLKIENQHILPAESFSPRIHKLTSAQEHLDPRFVAFFVLPFFLGLLFFRFFLGFALLVFLDAFLGLLVFFFLFRVAQRLAVFFHQRGDLIPVEIKKGVLVDFMLLHSSVALEFCLFLRLRPRVVLFELVEGLLVVVNFLEQRFQVRQFHLRLDRKIKYALAHRSVNCRERNFDVVFVTPPVQLDLVRQLHAIHGAVIVIKDFFLHAADGRGLLRDQVRLYIKEYLPLHATRRRHFKLQRVPSAHLRVPHQRQRDFVFLEIQQPRVAILRRRFQLHSFRTHQRAKLARRTLVPRRFPVVRLDDILLADQEFRVIPVGQLGIQRVRPALPVIARKRPFDRQRLNPSQRFAAPYRLHILIDYLPRLLAPGRRNPAEEIKKRYAKDLHQSGRIAKEWVHS